MKATARKLSSVLSTVRLIDDTMPIQELSCFLEVASHGGEMGIMELSEILGMSQSSASRNVAALSDWHYKKKPGLGLVQTVVDPMDMRKKNVVVTARGKRLMEQISNIMNTTDKRLPDVL